MQRITIRLPDRLADILFQEARRRGEPLSAVVRHLLEQGLDETKDGRGLPFVALGRSGRRHTARDAEKILAREWGGARRR